MWKWDDKAGRVLFWVIFGALLIVGAMIFAPFISAIMWATVLSVLTFPYYKRLSQKWKPNMAAAWVTLLISFALILPLIGVITVGGLQAFKMTKELTDNSSGKLDIAEVGRQIDEAIKPTLNQIGVHDFHVEEYVRENATQIRSAGMGPVSKGAQKLVVGILQMVFAMLTMFFMLRDGHRLLGPACTLIPLPRDETLRILRRVEQTIHSVFVGVVFVALIQGALALIAFLIAGVPGAVLWAIATFAFCLIPLLGSPFITVPVSLYLFSQGKVWQGVFVLVWGFGLISTIDNVLKPIFIGARTSLHPMAIFFTIIGGVVVFGPIGLMTGPVILTLILAFFEVIKTQRELAEQAAGETPALAPAEG